MLETIGKSQGINSVEITLDNLELNLSGINKTLVFKEILIRYTPRDLILLPHTLKMYLLQLPYSANEKEKISIGNYAMSSLFSALAKTLDPYFIELHAKQYIRDTGYHTIQLSRHIESSKTGNLATLQESMEIRGIR